MRQSVINYVKENGIKLAANSVGCKRKKWSVIFVL